jgi:two-component system sensor histidine kinase UhpB
MPLLWRIFMLNAAVLAAATAALALSPATVSFPVAATEAAVLAAGLVALLAANLLVLRRALGPLGRLKDFLRRVDPLRPGNRLPLERGTAPEIAAVTEAINDMIERLETERRESALRALAAEQDERRRVSRELHDEVGQALTAVMLQLGDAAPGALRETREAVRRALEDVRDIARRLRPVVLDDLGLESALRSLAIETGRSARVPVEPRIGSGLPQLSPEQEAVVYRVAQEALSNAARHGRPSSVALRLAPSDGGVRLEVMDDGEGFDPSRPTPGTGILGMRERAVLVGGRLEVRSRPGKGTTVRLEVGGP